jgi:hypothetical protein
VRTSPPADGGRFSDQNSSLSKSQRTSTGSAVRHLSEDDVGPIGSVASALQHRPGRSEDVAKPGRADYRIMMTPSSGDDHRIARGSTSSVARGCHNWDTSNSTCHAQHSPSVFSERMTPTTPEPSSCSRFCSLRPRFERTSSDVGGQATDFEPERWTTKDALGRRLVVPKKPGSRPGRPTSSGPQSEQRASNRSNNSASK